MKTLLSMLLTRPDGGAARTFVFVMYVLILLISTPTSSIYRVDIPNPLIDRYEESLRMDCNSFIHCTRLGGAVIGYAIDVSVDAVYRVFESPRANYKNPKDVSPIPVYLTHFDLEQPRLHVLFVATVLFRAVIFVPILFCALFLCHRAIFAVGFLAAMFLTVSGYGVLQFWLGETLFKSLRPDQWHGFWEFDQMTHAYVHDYMAAGFLALLVLLISRQWATQRRNAMVLAAAGQFSFPHLGLITGVATALFMAARTQGGVWSRFREGWRLLFWCGVASLAMALALAAALWIKHGGDLNFEGQYEKNFHWEDIGAQARLNAVNAKHLLLRFAYYLAVPAVLGVVVGLVFYILDPKGDRDIPGLGACAIATVCVFTGLVFAALIGAVTATEYTAERGREFLSAALLMVLGGYSFTTWALARYAKF